MDFNLHNYYIKILMKKVMPTSEFQITNVVKILRQTSIMWNKMFYLFEMFFNIFVRKLGKI